MYENMFTCESFIYEFCIDSLLFRIIFAKKDLSCTIHDNYKRP